MGDTGSMITGLLLAYLTLRFLSLNDTQLVIYKHQTRKYLYCNLSHFVFPGDRCFTGYCHAFDQQKRAIFTGSLPFASYFYR